MASTDVCNAWRQLTYGCAVGNALNKHESLSAMKKTCVSKYLRNK